MTRMEQSIDRALAKFEKFLETIMPFLCVLMFLRILMSVI